MIAVDEVLIPNKDREKIKETDK